MISAQYVDGLELRIKELEQQRDEHAAKVRHDITDCPMEKQRQLLLAQSSRNFLNSLGG